MARRIDAGRLQHAVAFDRRDTATDAYGGHATTWEEQFACRAQFMHLRGGETAIAARLEGRHPLIARIHASADSRAVTADWRMRDTRTGIAYAVRDVTPSDDRLYLDVLVESGVAA